MFKLSVAFVTLVLFQSVFAAPVLLTAANNNNAAAGVASRRDVPGRINGVSVTRGQDGDLPGLTDILYLGDILDLGDILGDDIRARQDTGDVSDDVTNASPAVSNSGALGDINEIVTPRDNLKRRQILPVGSDSAGVGSILGDPAELLGSLLGAAGQADTLGADTTQRKRAARGFAGGFLDNILEAFTGTAKGSDSESAQRRQLGPGADSTNPFGILDSILGEVGSPQFPPGESAVVPPTPQAEEGGLEGLKNPALSGLDNVPAGPSAGGDSGDNDDDNDGDNDDGDNDDGDNDDGDNDDGDNDDGDNDDGDNDDGDNDDGDNDDGDNDDGDNDDGDNDDGDNDDEDNDDGDNDDGDNDDGDNDDGDNDDGDNSDNDDNDGPASTISNALGGGGLDDVTDSATHPFDPRSSESRRPRPPLKVSGSL